MKVTSIVLCGGKERRFGSSKAGAVVGGKTVIDRIIERLGSLSDQVLVVTSPEKAGQSVTERAEILTDIYPGKGPLGGVYTGLVAALHPYAIVVGCDMPFLSTEMLRYMISVSAGFDAVIPRLDAGMVEPLHAVYARTCAPIIKERLERGELAINRLLGDLRIRYLERQEYLPLDPRMLSFFNINYPEDLEKANQIAFEMDTAAARLPHHSPQPPTFSP